MGSRRGRHVTRLFCRPCFRLGPLRTVQNLHSPFRFDFAHPPLKSQRSFADEPRGPTAISPLQVGRPTCRELTTGRTPLIFDRETPLRAPTISAKYTIILSEWPSQLSIAPTSSLPTGTPHTVSTEHDRDSQIRCSL